MEDLRRGWDLHAEFGLANLALYTLMYGDPRPGASPTAALEADEILHGLVQRVAEAGRLRTGKERSVQMIHAAGCGLTLTLIGTEPEDRDPALSGMTREAIFAAVITDGAVETGTRQTGGRAATRAVALKAVLPEAAAGLTPEERVVLSEWLERIIHPAG